MTFKVDDMVQVVHGYAVPEHPTASKGKVVEIFTELPNIVKVNFINVGPLMVYVSKLVKQEEFIPKFHVGDTVIIKFGDDYGERAVIREVSNRYGKWGYSLHGKNVNSWISGNYGDATDHFELVILPDIVDALESVQAFQGKTCGARARLHINNAKASLKLALDEEKARLDTQAKVASLL